MPSGALQVFEHQRLLVGATYRTNRGEDVVFTTAHFDALARYAERHRISPYELRHRSVVFQHMVGAIQVGALTIEILPKADRDAPSQDNDKRQWRDVLLYMVQLCPHVRLREWPRAELFTENADLLSLYIARFLGEAARVLREGLVRSYRTVEENRTSFQGRLLVAENVRRNFAHAELVYMATHELNADRLENQILLRALQTLTELRIHESLAQRTRQLLVEFPPVRLRDFDASDFERTTLGRHTDRYAEALALARLIILHHSPALRAGEEATLAFLVDMNRLFQEFVLAVLRCTAPRGVTIEGGQTQSFWPEGAHSPKQLLPDIVVRGSDGTMLIIDTKWKLPDGGWPADSDLRQVFAYGEYFGAKRTVLLYPEPHKPTPQHKGRFLRRDLSCELLHLDLSPVAAAPGRLDGHELGQRLWHQLWPDTMGTI